VFRNVGIENADAGESTKKILKHLQHGKILKSGAQCLIVAVVVCRQRLKVKIHPRTGHEGPEGKWRYSSTLSLTSALDWGVCGQPNAPGALPPVKTLCTHCVGGCLQGNVVTKK
jgi:hypothetical protein